MCNLRSTVIALVIFVLYPIRREIVMSKNGVFFIVVLVLSLAGFISAAPGDNLASGLPYTFNIATHYTEYGTELTDGSYGTDVTWMAGEWGAVTVTLDLGQVSAIDSFACYALQGTPVKIDVWVSNDGVTYTYGTELVWNSLENGIPPQGGYLCGAYNGDYRFVVDGLHLSGRYVKFAAYRAGRWMRLAEVEVFEGDFTPGADTYTKLTGGLDETVTFDDFVVDDDGTCLMRIAAGQRMPMDFNGDCYVDFRDFTFMAKDWMYCFDPEDETCEEPWLP